MPNLVASELKGELHRLIAHPRTACFTEKRSELVVGAILHVDADRLGFGLAHQHRITIPAPHTDKRANSRENASKGLRVFPGKRKRTDAARAKAARGAVVRILR